MSLKDKILNRVADFMYKYKSDDMDKILSCSIKGKTKGAVITTGGEFIKDIPSKDNSGLIDIDKLLTEEIQKNDMQSIVFCDNGRIICLTDQLGASYIETSHEYFDLANESVYIMCDSKDSYNQVKEYIQQSSKWHNYYKDAETIPYQKSFEKLFNIRQQDKNISSKKEQQPVKEEQEQSIESEKEIDAKRHGNIIQLDGVISSKGKTFLKKDNRQAKYIDVTQEDIYNGKKQNYTVTVSMEDAVLEDYGNDIKVGDKVRITGKLINYLDKNKNQQSIINSFDFEILERANQKDAEVEVTR